MSEVNIILLSLFGSIKSPLRLSSLLIQLDTVPVTKTTCNEFGVETSICGESGSSVDIARILVKYGIKSISCNIDAIDTIRAVVYQEEQEED